jgi:hypothetical protein
MQRLRDVKFDGATGFVSFDNTTYDREVGANYEFMLANWVVRNGQLATVMSGNQW